MVQKANSEDAFQQNILVIGLGLIGGSFAAALKSANVGYRIYGYDQNADALSQALQLDIIDEGCQSLADAVHKADVIVLSVPMLAMKPIFQALSVFDLSKKVLTDVGSSKRALIEAANAVFGEVPANLVPGHPIAGSEQSGVGAARSELFVAHDVILLPLQNTDPEALNIVSTLWEAAGAVVSQMDIDHHDEVLAKTSHLPHFLAFSLVDTMAGNPDNYEIFRFAAGGFRDFTRIAGSDPVMWHDVALGNSHAVLEALDEFAEGLDALRNAIVEKDSQALLNIFGRARLARRHFGTLLESRQRRVKKAGADFSARIIQKIDNDRLATANKVVDGMSTNTPEESMQTFIAHAGGTLSGEFRVPGDKSISHRSIMLGALGEGETVIEGFLEGEDALATLKAFRDMGVQIDGPHQGRVTIQGVGMHGLKAPKGPLYLGNAGTAMRLMAGLMSAQSFYSVLTGDESLSGRPMNRVVDPLTEMGAEIETSEGGRPPLKIRGGLSLKGIEYHLPMASAQVQSCLLLAGMYAGGDTVTVAPGIVRDHTNRMLSGFGYPVDVAGDNGSQVTISGGGKLTGTRIDVPGDVSSAAFFMVAASIAKGSDIRISHVGMNPTRSGVVEILQLMGANITLENESIVGGEPVADIVVRYAPLQGIEIPKRLVPIAIDEFPVLFVAAACADGQTTLTGAKELRVKESDRIQAMADGLIALGVDAQPLPDGMVIKGAGNNTQSVFVSGIIDSHGDHRIAMSFAVAALRSGGDIQIRDCANVATSFPDFAGLAKRVGMRINVIDSVNDESLPADA
ncbi:bifunctional prephenate dehydrogenase/3-phosphoshikimate 1-carboxyvinyltransferase [Endozoicomonas ascidiicola]|uniref:bifunctional prephenate dehydrogenase/3-phosphoshikimate 1-carboxyvinyltransferase n=1 Tax=Endozoicomonas ascidiicola TaxID=1698521 RepID=UPI00082FC1CE|nr:bifunctional prephenate dehydrogenase/3-phosphoshikimate 1-carboxyvinyltransferase [Endozoicomonas ascidiicola]